MELTYIKIDNSTIEVKCNICHGKHRLKVSPKVFSGKEGFSFACPMVERRYHLRNLHVETRRNIMNHPSTGVDKLRDHVKRSVLEELGPIKFEEKFERWQSVRFPDIGINGEYVGLLHQIINTYSMGYYFTSMTGAGALVERVLNVLVHRLKKYHTSDEGYSKLQRKESTQSWDLLIDTLKRWNVIDGAIEVLLIDIKKLRNESVHYNVDYNFNEKAPIMISKACEFIEQIWSITKRKDVFFFPPGEIWVKKSAENIPFVIEFVRPHCNYAHARYEIDIPNRRIIEPNPVIGTLTDEEFTKVRIQFQGERK